MADFSFFSADQMPTANALPFFFLTHVITCCWAAALLAPYGNISHLMDRILSASGVRKPVVKRRRKAVDTVAILVCWSIWLQRNDRTFNG
jgi:hypothetical protein